LLGDEKRAEFHALFSRGIRLNVLWLLPAVMVLFVVAKPFFTFWAGEAFGRESTPAFHILLLGLLFHVVAYVPHGAITAAGRTDIFAKLYWIELAFYALVAIALINSFQILGAAGAWTIRVSLDAIAIIWLAGKVVGVPLNLRVNFRRLLIASVILAPPILFAAFYDNFSWGLFVLVPGSLLIYLLFVWRAFLTGDEKEWLKKLPASFGLTESLTP
jgi:O-antigen/teichoic acid export membrane protein